MKTLLITLALVCFAFAYTSYEGSPVVLIRIDNPRDFEKFNTEFPIDSIDLWSDTYAAANDMEILFTKSQFEKLNTLKSQIKFTRFEIVISNFQDNINAEQAQMKQHKLYLEEKMKLLKTQKERDDLKYTTNEWFRTYWNYEDNVNYYKKIASDYPRMVELDVIGKSIEGRDINVLRIHSPGTYDPSKPSFYVQSLQHAREWVSGPTSQYFVSQLLKTYNSDPRAKRLLDKINIHWVPILNHDGFRFTHTSTRMWRKNRRDNGNRVFGVDLNRNWGSGFGGPGSSGTPSSDTYRGTAAYSEPETKAVDTYLKKYAGQFKVALDIHSYSQLNLRPWGKQNAPSPDESRLQGLGQKMVDAMRAVHRVNYRNIRAVELYIASGLASDDWYENHKLTAYTIELRPADAFGGGFALPAAQILPCAEENYAAILTLAESAIPQTKHEKIIQHIINMK